MQELTAFLRENGANAAAVIDVAQIVLRPEFRAACAQNSCGKYNTNWACPPACGTIEDCMAKVRQYRHALVFQTVGKLEDSFDYEGMVEAKKEFTRVAELLWAALPAHCPTPYLRLAAGGCKICPRCARLDALPCRFPEQLVTSMEAYGVDVTNLAKAAGMNYINGENTVTYFGAVLYD